MRNRWRRGRARAIPETLESTPQVLPGILTATIERMQVGHDLHRIRNLNRNRSLLHGLRREFRIGWSQHRRARRHRHRQRPSGSNHLSAHLCLDMQPLTLANMLPQPKRILNFHLHNRFSLLSFHPYLFSCSSFLSTIDFSTPLRGHVFLDPC